MLIFSGALVGFAIGLTGVGGGSLMTPILLLFNYPIAIAIGTDLLYAAITKASGMYFHHRRGHVDWKTMVLLAAGSIPVSIIINIFIIDESLRENESFSAFLSSFLGVMLILTALVMIFNGLIRRRINKKEGKKHKKYYIFLKRHRSVLVLLLGIVLGVCVTLSSVGAGAFGAAILFMLFPSWPTKHVVGTDIAHAVPLTFVAGLGYLFNGLVDYSLLLALVVGSLPGIYLGTRLGSVLSEKFLRAVLIFALLGLGLYFGLIQS
ncbi:MAG: sulfite exporter TauE/SafE family protein [Gammaproteobacteria bacterium]|nr:sulfite exporter TauE/SafE family protein [Gammaproteobacteria bacterium]